MYKVAHTFKYDEFTFCSVYYICPIQYPKSIRNQHSALQNSLVLCTTPVPIHCEFICGHIPLCQSQSYFRASKSFLYNIALINEFYIYTVFLLCVVFFNFFRINVELYIIHFFSLESLHSSYLEKSLKSTFYIQWVTANLDLCHPGIK